MVPLSVLPVKPAVATAPVVPGSTLTRAGDRYRAGSGSEKVQSKAEAAAPPEAALVMSSVNVTGSPALAGVGSASFVTRTTGSATRTATAFVFTVTAGTAERCEAQAGRVGERRAGVVGGDVRHHGLERERELPGATPDGLGDVAERERQLLCRPRRR